MKMLDLRVGVDRRHFNLYDDLRQAGAITEFHVLFFAAACVGFRQNRKKAPAQRQDKFWSRTFTAEEWACLYSMALAHHGGRFDQIQDDKKVIELMEEFATGGIDYMVESVLSDYLLTNSSEPRLDTSSTAELPRVLVYELWAMAEGPFIGHEDVSFDVSMRRTPNS